MIGMIGMAVIAAGVAVMAAEEAEDTTTVEVLKFIYSEKATKFCEIFP